MSHSSKLTWNDIPLFEEIQEWFSLKHVMWHSFIETLHHSQSLSHRVVLLVKRLVKQNDPGDGRTGFGWRSKEDLQRRRNGIRTGSRANPDPDLYLSKHSPILLRIVDSDFCQPASHGRHGLVGSQDAFSGGHDGVGDLPEFGLALFAEMVVSHCHDRATCVVEHKNGSNRNMALLFKLSLIIPEKFPSRLVVNCCTFSGRRSGWKERQTHSHRQI